MMKFWQVLFKTATGDTVRQLITCKNLGTVISWVKEQETLQEERLDGLWWYGTTTHGTDITITPAGIIKLED